ncbi:MAG: SAM-dependent methyltransferase [Candidatus Hadarchaeales archaeon]
MLFLIDHLEPELSEWIMIEYSHAAKIAGRENLIITNVTRRRDAKMLSRVARVDRRRAFDIFDEGDIIILDPGARYTLTPDDMKGKMAVVLGGILGDDPPRGRTESMLTRFAPGVEVRNIGPHQFSVDGAVYVAKRIHGGVPLSRIPVRAGVEIELQPGHSVVLPFAYPVVNGRPFIPKALLSYLKKPWKLNP